MNRRLLALLLTSPFFAFLHTTDAAEPFARAKFVQVVNEVNVLKGESLTQTPAEVEGFFTAPDLLKTGRRSRAQLEASDGTLTRIGSNTIFSFEEDSRTIHLNKGSLLFHSPKGKGGGTVVTSSATASVLGTTIIVAATNNGGFKVLCLEGRTRVDFDSGRKQFLNAGQMTFVLPASSTGVGKVDAAPKEENDSAPVQSQPKESSAPAQSGKPGPVLNFDLDRQQKNSSLLNGFSQALPSQPKINLEVAKQEKKIKREKMVKTDALIIGAKDEETVTVERVDVLEQTNESTVVVSDRDRLAAALKQNVNIGGRGGVSSANIFDEFIRIDDRDDAFLASSPFGDRYLGIIGQNIVFSTDVIDVSALDKSGQPFVGLFASERIVFRELDNVIVGLNESGGFRTTARSFSGDSEQTGSFSVTLRPDNLSKEYRFVIESQREFELDGDSIKNEAGGVELLVRNDDLIIERGASIIGRHERRSADLHITASGDITLNGARLFAENGQIHIGSIDPFDVPRPERVVVENGTVFGGAELSIQATDLVSMSDASVSNLREINIASRTVILKDIHFSKGSEVSLYSRDGLLSIGSDLRPGHVNFVSGVTYGNRMRPAEDFVSRDSLARGERHDFVEERIFIEKL